MQARRPMLLAMLVARDERTHDEIIAGFNECARTHREDATLSPRTFRRWLSGDVQTQPRPTQRRVARLYWGFPMGQLLEPAPPELLAPGGDRPATSDPVLDRLAISPAPAPAPAPAPPPVSSDADGDFFDPQFSVERQMSMATRRAARFTALAESQNIGAETVGQLRDQVGELEAVRYAEAGAQFARELTGSLTAWLPALEARAWAQLSDAERTLRAIGRAESARELVQPDD